VANLSELSPRKQRLLACACVRRVWQLLVATELRNVIAVAELFADGQRNIAELQAAYTAARLESVRLPRQDSASLAAWAATCTATDDHTSDRPFNYRETIRISSLVSEALNPGNSLTDPLVRSARQDEVDVHQRFLQDIELLSGIVFSPVWRTSTAVAIASGMYDSRDFSAMPILADALQDAGCENEDILNHCRDPEQVHVRGCWVVDLVLDKS
jgi:hypothetical protein